VVAGTLTIALIRARRPPAVRFTLPPDPLPADKGRQPNGAVARR
jgi:hypothetical protein